jgi:hypothetical protein
MLNVSCAEDMANACVTNTTNGPALLDGNSNCRVWKDNVETAFDFDPITYAGIQQQLDRCISIYCRNAGLNTNACSCMNFPFAQSSVCNAQASRGCNVQPSPGEINKCFGKEFSRVGGGYVNREKSGEISIAPYLLIQFDECIPYYCWNDLCYQPDSLLVSAIRSEQNSDSCINSICINVQGVDQITISDLQPPPPADAFQPRTLVMARCGAGHTTATPVLLPTLFALSVDSLDAVPFSIANTGDDILNLTFVTTTNDIFKCTPPSNITVGVHNFVNFNVGLDPTNLLGQWNGATDPNVNDGTVTVQAWDENRVVPKGILRSPTFFYTFPSGTELQTFSFQLLLELGPPLNRLVLPEVVNKDIPIGVNVGLLVSVGICIIAVIGLLVVQGRARKFVVESYKTAASFS